MEKIFGQLSKNFPLSFVDLTNFLPGTIKTCYSFLRSLNRNVPLDLMNIEGVTVAVHKRKGVIRPSVLGLRRQI